MDYSVVLEVSEAVDKVEEDADLGPERNGFNSGHDIVVKLVSLDELHHECVRFVECCLCPEILGDEIGASPLERGNNILLMFQLMCKLFLKLRFQFLDGNNSFLFLISLLISLTIQ